MLGRLSHPMALPAAHPAVDTILQAHPAAVIGRQHHPAAVTPIPVAYRHRAAAVATPMAVCRLRAAAVVTPMAACPLPAAAAAMATGPQLLRAAVTGRPAALPAAGINIHIEAIPVVGSRRDRMSKTRRPTVVSGRLVSFRGSLSCSLRTQ